MLYIAIMDESVLQFRHNQPLISIDTERIMIGRIFVFPPEQTYCNAHKQCTPSHVVLLSCYRQNYKQ